MRAFFSVVFGVLFIGSIAGGAVIWRLNARDQLAEWDPKLARKEQLPIPVRTVSVQEREISDTIGGTAVTCPNETAVVSIFPRSFEISDRLVAEVACRPGDLVTKGQVLFRFEPELFDAAVQHRRIMLENAEKIYRSLSGLKGQQAVADLEVLEAQKELSTARFQMKLAEYDLRNCEVSSPVSGIVEDIHIVQGTRITEQTNLANVHSLEPIHVRMDFPMQRIDSLQVGQTAEVVLDAFPKESFTGKVIRLAAIVDTHTRVIPVIIEVANPDSRIRAGISGYVRIRTQSQRATTIPKVAVMQKQRKSIVFCVEDGHAHIREIETGPVVDDSDIQVVKGLKRGDEVIIFGHDSLQENDLVNVDWKSWTQREQE